MGEEGGKGAMRENDNLVLGEGETRDEGGWRMMVDYDGWVKEGGVMHHEGRAARKRGAAGRI